LPGSKFEGQGYFSPLHDRGTYGGGGRPEIGRGKVKKVKELDRTDFYKKGKKYCHFVDLGRKWAKRNGWDGRKKDQPENRNGRVRLTMYFLDP